MVRTVRPGASSGPPATPPCALPCPTRVAGRCWCCSWFQCPRDGNQPLSLCGLLRRVPSGHPVWVCATFLSRLAFKRAARMPVAGLPSSRLCFAMGESLRLGAFRGGGWIRTNVSMRIICLVRLPLRYPAITGGAPRAACRPERHHLHAARAAHHRLSIPAHRTVMALSGHDTGSPVHEAISARLAVVRAGSCWRRATPEVPGSGPPLTSEDKSLCGILKIKDHEWLAGS